MEQRDQPTVLYVDDEHGNRLVFEQTFGQRFLVQTCATGAAALEVLKTGRVAVLVTDQRMPGMTGNDLLSVAKERYPDVIRVVITAYADLDPILRAVNEGLVARYLVKPWQRDQVEHLLSWALETFCAGQESSETQARLLETERLATLGTIHAAMIHDLKQPLSYLIVNADYLAGMALDCPELLRLVERAGDQVAPHVRTRLLALGRELPELVEDMRTGCTMMNELVRGTKALLERLPETEARTAVPLSTIRFALSVCRRRVEHVRGELDLVAPSSVPPVAMAPACLAQVLINLVSNAGQALERKQPSGGQVMVRVAETASQVEIAVEDNGPGMPTEVLQKVGTPFFTTRKTGTGLGLSQCRRLVEGIGGQMEISSQEGVGTTVRLVLNKAIA